jgi:hypothetical protein
VTHNRDIVPSVPPTWVGFHHVATEVWIVEYDGAGVRPALHSALISALKFSCQAECTSTKLTVSFNLEVLPTPCPPAWNALTEGLTDRRLYRQFDFFLVIPIIMITMMIIIIIIIITGFQSED